MVPVGTKRCRRGSTTNHHIAVVPPQSSDHSSPCWDQSYVWCHKVRLSSTFGIVVVFYVWHNSEIVRPEGRVVLAGASPARECAGASGTAYPSLPAAAVAPLGRGTDRADVSTNTGRPVTSGPAGPGPWQLRRVDQIVLRQGLPGAGTHAILGGGGAAMLPGLWPIALSGVLLWAAPAAALPDCPARTEAKPATASTKCGGRINM